MNFSERVDGYFRRLNDTLRMTDANDVEVMADKIVRASDSGSKIFLVGNGGSAATASHYANDLVMAFSRTGRSTRVLCLSDNAALLTGLANDYSFEEVFEKQVRTMGEPGDVLILISASGNSPNLLRAVQAAHEMNIVAIAVVGFDGGALKSMCDLHVHTPTSLGDYGVSEDAHLVINHAIAEVIRSRGQ